MQGPAQQDRAKSALYDLPHGCLIGPIHRFSYRTIHSTRYSLDSVEIVVPPMGDSVSEGSIAAILKRAGDIVKEDDVIAQIETDKVTIDVKYTLTKPGKVERLLVDEAETVIVGQPVAVVEQGHFEEAKKPAEASPPTTSAPKQEAAKAPAAPAKAPAPTVAEPPVSAAPSKPSARPERTVKMTRLRMRVAERLKGAQNTYAMLTTFNEIDMTNLIELREAYKAKFEEVHGVKLGFMSAFVKAAAAALVELPVVNAVIDGDSIVYREYVDVSIAVATPKGLVVPVLRDVDQMSFADVEKSIAAMGRKARDGSISIDDMAGGTFTISNGGVYGSMFGTPIINPPQSAILGMHAILQRPAVVNKTVLPRPMMYIALTYDHRLIDGREAVTFLKRIKEGVEDPRRLVLQV